MRKKGRGEEGNNNDKQQQQDKTYSVDEGGGSRCAMKLFD